MSRWLKIFERHRPSGLRPRTAMNRHPKPYADVERESMLASTSCTAPVLLKPPLTVAFLASKRKSKREKYAKLKMRPRKGKRREANPLRRSVFGDLTRVERFGCRATESFESLHIRILFKFCQNLIQENFSEFFRNSENLRTSQHF